MTNLRKQFDLARAEYRSAQYPGDLALILPSGEWRSSYWKSALAFAAMVLLVVGVSIHMSYLPLTTARIQAWLPSVSDLPKMPQRGEMAGAIKNLTPPEVPDLLMGVKQPLVSSGQFIIEIGKDIAHHADALFHMG